MPYYNAGDYYGRGDYYQAGGIFSGIGHFIGGLAKAAVHTGIGFLTGGPKGAIVGAATGLGAMTKQRTEEALLGAGGSESAYTPELAASHATALARGPMIAPPAPGGMMPMGPMLGYGGQRRMHPNKSTYVTRGGGTSKWPGGLSLHPKGSTMVTSRRMNVGNARALRRALRRARGFAKLARKVLVATSHYKKGGGHHRRKK